MRGRGVFEGVAGAYPRALYRSMGFGDDDFEKPLIGIVNSWSEVDPGHFHLRELAAWVKEGVREAGGATAEFNTVAPCDGIAQGKGMHSILPLRDVIAASVELMVDANRFDGIVMLCSCDKIVPGMLMAAARLDLPTIFVTGGPMLPGHAADPQTGAEREIILSDVKEAMGRYKAGRITEEQFYEIECKACGGPGACAFMGTANTMNCIVEALGLTLPGCATLPALDPDRAELCRASGRRIVELVRAGVHAGQMLTQASLENAVRVTLALGGSTNATLHLPAIANEIDGAGVDITPDTFDRLGRQTPLIAKFAPASRLTVVDLHAAGGIPAVLSVLAPLLDRDAPTVDGRTIGEIAADARVLRDDVLHPLDCADRGAGRHRGAPRQSCARRRRGQAERRGPGHAPPHRPGARLRVGRRGAGLADVARHQPRRRAGDPQRGAGGRAGDARAQHPRRDAGRHGPGRDGRHDHRRPLFGRNARAVHRPRLPRGVRRRADRRGAGGRPDRDRHPEPPPGAPRPG